MATPTEQSTPPLRHDGPTGAARKLALTHGAGAPVDDAFFETLTRLLAEREIHVARFEFPYMRKRREDGKRRGPDRATVLQATWRAVARELGPEWAIGGKSMGGRIASMVADEVGAAGLVCLGYPFHPPGKPTTLRVEHLRALATPALILQGTRDPFGTPEEVKGYELAAGIAVHWLEDGDHSLKPRKRSGRSTEQNLAEAADEIARFLTAL
jgi:predicted alpha/beta-hydrolase family hydrolase